MVKKDINLVDLFQGFQNQMNNKLSNNRMFIQHPAEKGAATEFEWIEWLNDYLPKRYRATSAFIIDSENGISDQIDLVIHDTQYSPFVFNQSNIEYIPSESVYAVFELKQELNSTNIEYAKNKIKSVRNLKRTSAQIVHAGGTFKPREPHEIIGGIITLTTAYNLIKSGAFKENILEMEREKMINIGLCLDGGSFKVNDKTVDITDKENALLSFFLDLLEILQNLGTVPAMDINAYRKYV